MKKTNREIANERLLKTLGISYDEYEKLDEYTKEKLLENYRKKRSSKSSEVPFLIGGGDESIIIKVPKGKKILTPNGYVIAGETLEENKKRWDEKIENADKEYAKFNKEMEKAYKKYGRLDFKTWLFLFVTHAVKKDHPEVVDLENKEELNVIKPHKHEVYVFSNYEEYQRFFLMYLNSIDNDVIDAAIYTRDSKGHIVAFKGLCERIIIKSKMKEFYQSLTSEEIDLIHSKGKITPYEAIEVWKSFGSCVVELDPSLPDIRCEYFDYNCQECMMEYASHQKEYDLKDLSKVRERKKGCNKN